MVVMKRAVNALKSSSWYHHWPIKGSFTNTYKGGPDAKNKSERTFFRAPLLDSKIFQGPVFSEENRRQPHRKSYRPTLNFSEVK